MRKSPTTIAVGACSAAVEGVNVNCFCAVSAGLPESVTCTVNVKLPAAGVPEITPVEALNERPELGGNDPEEMLQV